MTQIQFQAGIASDEAVAQAETQLEATQAQDTNLDIARAQFEHAIALLIGQPASTFSLPVEPLKANPPAIPFGCRRQLLERRPDVAAAERVVAQANAQIGVAQAAYYPNVTLSASAGLGRHVHRGIGLHGPAASGPWDRRWRRRFSMPGCGAPRCSNFRRRTIRPWPITGRRC